MNSRLYLFLILILNSIIQGTNCDLLGQAGTDSSAFMLFKKGGDYYRSQIYDSAIIYYRRAAEHFRRNDMKIKYLESLNEAASAHIYLHDIDSAESILDEVISRSGDMGQDSSILLIRAYQLKANIRADISGYASAIGYMKKALALSCICYGEDNIKTASPNGNLGIAYSMAGQYRKAIFHCRKASEIIRKHSGEDHPNVASGYNTIGNVYLSIGKLDSAQLMHEKALSIRLKTLGPDHTSTAASYSNLSAVFYEKGDFQQALTYEKSVYIIRKKVYGENHPLTALCYNNIGATYEATGNYDEALKNHLKSLSIRESTLPPGHPDLAMSYNNIGNVYSRFNEFGKALGYHNRALAIRKQLYGNASPKTAQVINNIGDIYFRMGEIDRAILYFSEAADDLRSAFDNYIHPELALYENNLARCYISLRKPESALLHVKAAMDINKCLITGTDGVMDTLVFYQNAYIESLALKARIGYLNYQLEPGDISALEESVNTYNDAIDYMVFVRNNYAGDQSKEILAEKNNILFDESVNTLFQLYKTVNDSSLLNRMFQMMEKGKYGILREHLSSRKAFQVSGIPDSLVQREKELGAMVGLCRSRIMALGGNSSSVADPEESQKLYKDFFRYDKAYKELISDCENKYPRYLRLRSESYVPSIYHLTASLDDNTVILSYTLADTSLFIMVLQKSYSELIHVPVNRSFNNDISAYINGIKSYALNDFGKLSGKLYSKLIAPVEKLIRSKKYLIIIPDKILLYLPFETLCNDGDVAGGKDFSRPAYLVKKFGISYQLSATMCQSSLQQPPLKKAGTYSFIGFAPVFSPDSTNSYLTARNKTILNTISNDDKSLRSVSVNGKLFNELPYSEKEIEEIITLFHNKNLPATGYFHSFASESAFRREAGKYSFIHLSTHGLTNENLPALSGLIFSPVNVSRDTSAIRQALQAQDEDGILTASDLYGLDLSADLAVLSACESGIGKLIRGEGLISMSRGFFFSGVPNIIYSLWKVGDKSTRELMVNFYSGILNGKSFNRSLQESKLKMIYNKNYAYPLYWGGFVLVGPQ